MAIAVTDSYKSLYRTFVDDVINGGKFDLIPDLYTSDYVDHSSPPGAPGGLGGVRAIFAMFRTAFPDIHFEINEMVAEGDRVATRVTGHGTNTGPFMGAPPTSRQATWGSMGIFRVADGRIAEHWGQPDLLGLMTQLGVLPPRGRSAAPEASYQARPDYSPADAHDPELLERNKAVVRRVFDEAFTGGDTTRCAEYVARDYIDQTPMPLFQLPSVGPEALAGSVRAFRTAFPDLRDSIEEQVAEGTSVVTRVVRRGTHRGAFGDIPPTGRQIAVPAIVFFRIGKDGLIVERHGIADALGLMQQLGLAPGPGHP